MGDLTVSSPWAVKPFDVLRDEYVYTFTKEACEEALQAIKKGCQPAYGFDATLNAALMGTVLSGRTTTLGQESLADEIFEKLTS